MHASNKPFQFVFSTFFGHQMSLVVHWFHQSLLFGPTNLDSTSQLVLPLHLQRLARPVNAKLVKKSKNLFQMRIR